MIPPDYTALERYDHVVIVGPDNDSMTSRVVASADGAWVKAADALVLAASLQDEKKRLEGAIREWSDASAEADRLALGYTHRVQKAEQALRECGVLQEPTGEVK